MDEDHELEIPERAHVGGRGQTGGRPSSLADTGDRYIEIFNKIGVADAVALPIAERTDADRKEYIEQFEGATGIFITGGNQLRLSTILGGTLVARA